MIHLGDICNISGRDAPTVNVIIGGSPCQDLSIAGKRAGLNGERSGLFMEQIRIIKEMREKDAESGRTGADIRPRFMVWENVPGAFSVNGGRDFAAVLEETIRVVDKEAPDIQVPCDGWTNSGCFMGNGYSIAWRVLDAQFWGVPQRRRRIALVADFGGECAPEILFERESVSGYSESCETARQGTAGDAADSTGTTSDTVWCLQGNGIDRAETAGCNGKGWTDESCYTLNTIDRPAVCYAKTTRPHSKDEAPTIEPADISPTLNQFDTGDTRSNTFVCLPINTMVASRGNEESRTTFGVGNDGDAQFTLSKAHEHAVCYGICADASNSMKSSNPHSGIYEADTSRTLDNNCGNPACNQGGIAVCQKLTESASK